MSEKVSHVGLISSGITVVIACCSGLWYRISGKLSTDTFQVYVDGQTKLMEVLTKACEANTRASEKLYDKLDGKQDKE